MCKIRVAHVIAGILCARSKDLSVSVHLIPVDFLMSLRLARLTFYYDSGRHRCQFLRMNRDAVLEARLFKHPKRVIKDETKSC